MTYDLSFITDEVWKVQREHADRMMAITTGRQPEIVPFFHEAPLDPPVLVEGEHTRWLHNMLGMLREHRDLFKDPLTYRPLYLSVWEISHRVSLHMVPRVLGCDVPVTLQDGRPVPWCQPLTGKGVKMSDLALPCFNSHPWVQEIGRMIRFLVDATEGKLPLELPFLSEPLLAAVDLFGEDFIVTLVTDPDLARHVLRVCTDTTMGLFKVMREAADGATIQTFGAQTHIPLPPGYYNLFGCTTHLISGDTYDQVVRPYDEELLDFFEGGGMHLCGRHTQHIGALRRMRRLNGVEINDDAAIDLKAYFDGLREDQFIVLYPTTEMTVERALALTDGGRRLVVRAVAEKEIRVS